ncbi:MAG: hypothetical protein NZ959_03665 [Armatimonadetes bacterium]|nr:hypothetical protein [Armatimonadota bacterium]MDW8121739.1 DUF6785 family protein [Armatimonadota bacterium]
MSSLVRVEEKEKLEQEQKPTHSILFLAFLFVIAITVAGCFSAFLRYDLIGTGHLPRCALFPLLCFSIVNLLFRKIRQRPLLSRSDLLFLYITILVMTGIPGQQYADYLYLGLIAPIYYSIPRHLPSLIQNPDLDWLPFIPDWMVPSKDPRDGVIMWVIEGMPEGMRLPWQPWVTPLIFWTLFYFALFFAKIALAALLQPQWAVREKLTFPLCQVPREVADDRTIGRLLRSPLMWIGFSIPTFVYTLRAIHIYFPYFPNIDLYKNWGLLFLERPWDQLNFVPFNIYFDMIGFAYLINTDVGFSFWFFYVVRRLLMVSRAAMGLTEHAEPLEYQTIGGFIALSLFHIYVAREYIKALFSSFLPGKSKEQKQVEPHLRRALLFFCACLIVLVSWSFFAGLALRWTALLFTLHFIWRILLARMVAEAGLFVYWLPNNQYLMLRLFGRDALGQKNIVALHMIGTKLSDSATCVLPQALQGFKIAQDERLSFSHSFTLLISSVMLSVLTCHPASLYILYTTAVPKMGWWMRGYPQGNAESLRSYLTQDYRIRGTDFISLLSGAVVTLALSWLRWQFFWWPFHPLGYAGVIGTYQWAAERYMFSIFLGWLLKALVLRLGGINSWHLILPFAMGLILGNTCVLFILLIIHFFYPTNEVVVIE